MPTFEILYNGTAIKCLDCQRVSFNTQDVIRRYCGACHKFHEAPWRELRTRDEDRATAEGFVALLARRLDEIPK
jgi:hypothetical protein